MKKLLALLLALMMVFSLMGCEKDDDRRDDDDDDDERYEDREDEDRDDEDWDDKDKEEEELVTYEGVYLPVAMEKTSDAEGIVTVRREEYLYNDYGLMEKSLHYDPDGNLQYTYEYTYDEEGRVISRTYHSDDYTSTVTYGYDSMGKQFELSWNDETYEVEFDDQGRLSRYQEDDSEYHLYVYGEDSYTLNVFNAEDDSLDEYTVFTLNENGDITRTSRYLPDGELLYCSDYLYDGELLTDALHYEMGSDTYVSTSYSYYYDKYGNCSQIVFDGNYYSGDSVSVYTIEEVQVRSDSPIFD